MSFTNFDSKVTTAKHRLCGYISPPPPFFSLKHVNDILQTSHRHSVIQQPHLVNIEYAGAYACDLEGLGKSSRAYSVVPVGVNLKLPVL